MTLKLPKFIEIDINNYVNEIDTLYKIYLNELYDANIIVLDKNITYRRDPLDDGKHECFWHLVTEGKKDNRVPDFERIRRIHWGSYILKNYEDTEIVCWEKIHKGNKGAQRRIFFWLENESYLIVLGENRKKTSFELITAYYVNHPGTLKSINRDKNSCIDPRR